MAQPLDIAAVRRIALLARLELTSEQETAYAATLSQIVGYVERLGKLDLAGVEPMAHVEAHGSTKDSADPAPLTQRGLAADEPGAHLTNAQLGAIAPAGAFRDGFIDVPKVLGEGGGA